MAQKMSTRKMLIVTDASGRTVAAAHLGAASTKGLGVGIMPLPGQQIHEVELPDAVAELSGRDFHQVISQARMEPGALKLTFPEIRIERAKHEE